MIDIVFKPKYAYKSLTEPVSSFTDLFSLITTSKERTARYCYVAENVGGALTFWLLDEQSKKLSARSVVRPFQKQVS